MAANPSVAAGVQRKLGQGQPILPQPYDGWQARRRLPECDRDPVASFRSLNVLVPLFLPHRYNKCYGGASSAVFLEAFS